jgi:tRNA-specific 2-thiouridylase
LWRVSQNALSKTLLPIGGYKKTQIREIAKKLGLKSADTPDSQEICFVPDDNYRELLKIRIPDIESKFDGGDIIYKDKVVGKHKGYPYYTIGQRRGLQVAIGKPIYVTKIDAENNVIYVDDEEGLYETEFFVNDINLMMYDKLPGKLKANVKIRYKDKGDSAVIEQVEPDKIKVVFDKPKKSITPGQSAVFYEGDDVIGGGIIQL